VVIRRSAASDTRQLVADLAADGPDGDLRREAAIARLRVIGARAVRHILPLLAGSTPAPTRIAALRALEGCGGAAVVTPILAALRDPDPDIRVASLAVARGLLDSPRGPEVLDLVTGLALDHTQPLPVRRSAVAALADLPAHTLRPLLERLRTDPDPAVRALIEHQQIVPATDPLATLAEAAETRLPADPDYVLSLVAEAGAATPLPTLHRLVGVIRDRERTEVRPARRRDWLTVRGAVHQALASRSSRVAAYDLREAIETAEAPLPDDFLRAAGAIGDATVLEALAGAFVRARAPDASGWRTALAGTAREIVGRERLTTRHAAVKRLRARYGEAVAGLLPR
jgi:HEAT repeat protein